MGWLWTCLGLRGAKSSRRIGGRVSSDTYLAPQFDPTKTPRIEDYLQARQASYDVFGNGHPPTSPGNCDKDLAAAAAGTKGSTESGKAEYGPYWGYYYSDASPAREEFPRARKSFSELLMETDTLERGPLALAAMAAAADRAARIKFNAFPGFDVKEAPKVEDKEKATLRSDTSEAVEWPTPHSMAMQEAASMSSLSKDHLEASKAVAAFKESRRKSQLSSQQQQQQQTTMANPSYISSLFRSPRKRTIPIKSRSLQSPLSPVPEALSLDESKRTRDESLPVVAHSHSSDGISSIIMETFSCELETLAIPSSDEDWDDYVLVEMALESPNVENQTQHVRPSTSSIHGGIHEEGSNSKAAFQDDATSARVTMALDSEGREEEDDNSQVLRTPVRDLMVTPEVFMSPKTTPNAEYNFRRVNDMDPEERPIFGSLADHWEAAWATKRPVWDGRGILNDTNKYREDQKVMWHAVPFEERLAQALATQEDPVLQRNSYKSPTSRLSTSRSSRSLRAH